MSDEYEPADFEAVREHELNEIAKRRREANLPPVKDKDGRSESPSGDLVGLALSGGGVRSASFNLGFIQSLYEKGILRHVDYMSTVSGGGYVGSSLSSLALHPETEFDWKTDRVEPAEGNGSCRDGKKTKKSFPVSPSDDGRQPPRVLELIHGGHYLRRPLIFLNRYLVGVLLTNVVALSLVIAIATLAAWLFRYLDHTWMINWLFALGFQGDIGRAFFPMTLFFVFWLLMWGVSFWRKGSQAEGIVARWFMTLTIVSLLLACAALLGTGDVSLTHLHDNYGVEPPSEFVRLLGGELKTYFIIALVIALIPYLRIKDLIRSGTRPRSAVEGWVFGIASRALLYGIPLLIFGWLARENISRFNENRFVDRYGIRFNTQYDFVPLDFTSWSDTWQEIELRATKTEEESDANELVPLKETSLVSQAMWDATKEADVAASRKLVAEISAFDREATMFDRWLMYLGYVITRQENDVSRQFDRREDYLAKRWDVCNQLTNSIQVQPGFYRNFNQSDDDLAVQLVGLKKDERERRIAEIKAIAVDAALLETRIKNFDRILGLAPKELAEGEQPMPASFDEWIKERNEILNTLDELSSSGVRENDAALQGRLKALMAGSGGEFVNIENELKKLNWQLLVNYWGGELSPKSTVYAMVCLNADQATRLHWLMWALGCFLVSACVVNMNSTSLHGFYRNMLSKMWVIACPGMGRQIPLARLETVARGAPYHLIGATVHMLGRRRRPNQSTTDTFIFSQSFCGADCTGYVPTERYMKGRFDLSNAMALSGAAVSPTQVHNPLLAVMLMLSNSRLGQWLPNPGHRVLIPKWMDRIISWCPPVPLRLIIGAAQTAEQRNYCFVSDGGHHENLGLELLLHRRCRLIIASDVTSDADYEFRDFIRLLRRMRFEFGIRIVGIDGPNDGVPLDTLTPQRLKEKYRLVDREGTSALRLSESNHAESHYFVARIRYPDEGPKGSPREGYLIYVKPNFTGDEAVDLTRYQLEDPAFPHDPTADQFYDPQKFESYRQLGFHIGKTVCSEQFDAYRCLNNSLPSLGTWTPVTGAEPSSTSGMTDRRKSRNADGSGVHNESIGLVNPSQRHPR